MARLRCCSSLEVSRSRERKALSCGDGVWGGEAWVGADVLIILWTSLKDSSAAQKEKQSASCWQTGSLAGVDLVLASRGSLPQAGLEGDLHIRAVWYSVCRIGCLKVDLMGSHLGVTQPCFFLTHQIECRR